MKLIYFQEITIINQFFARHKLLIKLGFLNQLNLLQDMALMKESHNTYKRIMWAVIAAIVGTWAKNIVSMMP